MSIDNIKSQLPAYAKDLKLNLGTIASSTDSLSEQQLWGTLLAAAIASRSERLLSEIAPEAAEHLDESALEAARAAAAIMGMNNIYYRTMHMLKDDEYGKLPARLRMNVIANPGVDKVDFELWSLAVSAINGCDMCVNAHEQGLRKAGVDRPAIQDTLRIAAVIHAIGATLDAEAAVAAGNA